MIARSRFRWSPPVSLFGAESAHSAVEIRELPAGSLGGLLCALTRIGAYWSLGHPLQA